MEGASLDTPRVSVVVTTYNRADLVCKAVDSAVDQDYPESQREIILVDDGSTDDTRQLVEARYGGRVRYVHKANGGFVSACALGFSLARGEIVAQLDSDDTWSSDKLSRTVPKFDEADDVVAVFHDLRIVTTDGSSKGTLWDASHARIGEAPCDALEPYLAGFPIPSWTSASLWRRAALERILPFPEGLMGYADAYCARHIVFLGRICAIPEALGTYLVHADNDSGKGGGPQDLKRLERGIRESRIMSEAFNRRCEEFGRRPSQRRVMIQKLALADACVSRELLTSRAAAARWVLDDELGLPALARMQILFNLYLPPRLAVFLKNRVIGRFVPLD
jgi:hypothetical protein